MSKELTPEQLQEQVDQLSEDRTGKPSILEEQISGELVKANVTEAVITSLREKYLPLNIEASKDKKETYLLVKDGRKECKSIRVMATKICKKGREDATAIQKAWIAKEKEVTDKIAEVEDYLEKQEKKYEAEIAKEKEEQKRKQEERLIFRQQALTAMGTLYADGMFTLGKVSFEFSAIKESDEVDWLEVIVPKYEDEYKKIRAEQIEQERKRQEEEAELKRQKEELERKQKELTQKEADLKAEADRQAAEAKAAREEKENSRMSQLISLGLKFDFVDHFIGYDCFVPTIDIMCHDDQKWAKLIEGVTAQVSRIKEEEAEEKRKEQERKDLQNKRYAELFPFREYGDPVDTGILFQLTGDEYENILESKKAAFDKAEQEKAKRIADEAAKAERERIEEEQRQIDIKTKQDVRKRRKEALLVYNFVLDTLHGDLADFTDEQWVNLVTEAKASYDENIRKQEEERKAEELAKAGEKVKWASIITQLSAIEIPKFVSGQYAKKAAILREKLEEIKAL